MTSSQIGKRLFLSLVVAWIFEGALRKWIFPGLQQSLFFIRDPFIIALYALAIARGRRGVMRGYMRLAVVYGLILTGLAVFDVMRSTYDPLVAAYGWRMYVLPIFLPVAVASLGDWSWLESFVRLLCQLSIPMSLIVFVQVNSSQAAWINRTLLDGSDLLTTANGIVRASSTFTSPAGHSMYVSASFAAVLLARSVIVEGQKKRSLPLVFLANSIMVALSGSRLIVFNVGIILVAYLIFHIFWRPGRGLARLGEIGALVAAMAFIVTWLAHPVVQAFLERFQAASQSENSSGRVFGAFTGWVDLISYAPEVGGGPGMLARGGVSLSGSTWIENELTRQLYELGVVVFCFVFVLRLLILAWAARSVFSVGDAEVGVLIFVFVAALAPVMCWGQITGQGSINGFAWILISLIALMRLTHPVLYETDRVSTGRGLFELGASHG